MDIATLINPVGQNSTFSGGNELTIITASGTANTFGPWVSLGTTPAYPCNNLRIIGRSYNASGAAIPILINLALGPSSTSLTPWISDIVANSAGQYNSIPMGLNFPLWVPPNQQVWAQMAVDSTDLNNWELGLFCDFVPGRKAFHKVTSYANVSTSSGLEITIPGSGAWGPFTITSAFGPHNALMFGFQPSGDPSYYSASLEMEFNGDVLFPLSVVGVSNSGAEATINPRFGPYKTPFIGAVSLAVSGYAILGVSNTTFQIPLYGLD